MKKPKPSPRKVTLQESYPAIAEWIDRCGWIELGQDDCRPSTIRVLDPGGMIWESTKKYRSLDDLFDSLERELAKHISELGQR